MPYKLEGKNILVLSPQAWGAMFLSKHHYTIALAEKGNKVFFLNPPVVSAKGFIKEFITIKPSGINENLFFVEHSLPFPYVIKFKLQALYHWLVKSHIARLLKAIDVPIDIIWSYDLGNLYSLKSFRLKALKIFHPVDEPRDSAAIAAATGANAIFSVTTEILDKYAHTSIPSQLIGHGVAKEFLGNRPVKVNSAINVGMSGNFLRGDIDRPVLLQIIDEHPQIIFHCWGSYKASQSNIAGSDDEATKKFINVLSQKTNVVLYGAVDYKELAQQFAKVDAFLICYDVNLDQSKGTNYHKIMEYLCTGKVIISNNVTAYAGKPDLVNMVTERSDNKKLPALFTKIINELDTYNSAVLSEKRIAFAMDNTYHAQIHRIEACLNNLSKY